jgi:hypothetical protein
MEWRKQMKSITFFLYLFFPFLTSGCLMQENTSLDDSAQEKALIGEWLYKLSWLECQMADRGYGAYSGLKFMSDGYCASGNIKKDEKIPTKGMDKYMISGNTIHIKDSSGFLSKVHFKLSGDKLKLDIPDEDEEYSMFNHKRTYIRRENLSPDENALTMSNRYPEESCCKFIEAKQLWGRWETENYAEKLPITRGVPPLPLPQVGKVGIIFDSSMWCSFYEVDSEGRKFDRFPLYRYHKHGDYIEMLGVEVIPITPTMSMIPQGIQDKHGMKHSMKFHLIQNDNMLSLKIIESSSPQDVGKTLKLHKQNDDFFEKINITMIEPCCDYFEIPKLWGTWKYIGKEKILTNSGMSELSEKYFPKEYLFSMNIPRTGGRSTLFYEKRGRLEQRFYEFHLHDGVLSLDDSYRYGKFSIEIENDILKLTLLEVSSHFFPEPDKKGLVNGKPLILTFQRTTKQYKRGVSLKNALTQ